MYSSNLNLLDAEKILNNLHGLSSLKETGHSVYLGSRVITTSPSNTTTEKMSNYLSTWCGWSSDLYYLPQLTERLVTFMKSEEGKNIKSTLVTDAIAGLSVLLDTVKNESENRQFVEKSMDHLLLALGIATLNNHTPSAQPLSLGRFMWQNYGLYYLSTIPFVVNRVQEKVFGSKRDLFFKASTEKLKEFIYYDVQEDSHSIKEKILELFLDPELNRSCSCVYNGNVAQVPNQFYLDCARMETLTLNGALVSDLKNHHIEKEEICTLFEQTFEPLLFKRLGTILHQSLFADLAEKWFIEDWPSAWREPGFPFESYISNSEGYHFSIDRQGNQLKVDAKLILNCGFVENAKIPLGFVVVKREMVFDIPELLQNLSELPPQQRLPSFNVKQTISDLYPSLEAARHFLT
ncbi:MAG: hypothetical protein LW832_07405 [Parachlamydia sp.]|jgi:hypothetical protein|nr:hypothetical protein [Parachlamydia sp.]